MNSSLENESRMTITVGATMKTHNQNQQRLVRHAPGQPQQPPRAHPSARRS